MPRCEQFCISKMPFQVQNSFNVQDSAFWSILFLLCKSPLETLELGSGELETSLIIQSFLKTDYPTSCSTPWLVDFKNMQFCTSLLSSPQPLTEPTSQIPHVLQKEPFMMLLTEQDVFVTVWNWD